MEDFHDVATVVADSLGFALVFTLAICVPIYLAMRVIPALSQFRAQSTWKGDLRSVGIVAAVVFGLVFLPSLLVGSVFSSMCGTGDVTEVSAPDGLHKLVVYNFDCGATTDFSLHVSLLRQNQKLRKYRTATVLYSHYHQRPTSSGPDQNFQVDWIDPSHVVMRVANLEGTPKTKSQDGVRIDFEQFP